MDKIAKMYILLNRDLPADSAHSTKRKILQMKVNGRTYESQLAANVEPIVQVVGRIPFQEPVHVFSCLIANRFIPSDRASFTPIFDRTTFGWFEFDNGIQGAIAAEFRPEDYYARSSESSGKTTALPPAKPRTRAIEFKAATIDEARQLFQSLQLSLSAAERLTVAETIVSRGDPTCVQWTLGSLDGVQARMGALLPGTALISQNVVQPPLSESVEVEAPDDATALVSAQARFTQRFDSVNSKCLSTAKSGLFGWGRKPGRYLVTGSRPGIVEVTYREPARLRFIWQPDSKRATSSFDAPPPTREAIPLSVSDDGRSETEGPAFVQPASRQEEEASPLVKLLDRSEGVDALFETLRTRSAAEIESLCKTYPIDSIRTDWGSQSELAKSGEVGAIASEYFKDGAMRDIRRFEIVTTLAQTLVRYDANLKLPELRLPKSLPAAALTDILMARLMPFIRKQRGVNIAQTLRVRLYDFAMALVHADRNADALDCLLTSRPSLKGDHDFWIAACCFNIAANTSARDDIVRAISAFEPIVSRQTKVPAEYLERAGMMLSALKKELG